MENNLNQHSFPGLIRNPNTIFSSASQFQQYLPSPKLPEPILRKGGRKKLRPGNPLKTEVMDKFWLRCFKNFVKKQFKSIKSLSSDSKFWNWYKSNGEPGKKSKFLSYNSKYKEKLFSSSSFCALFAAWALGNGFMLSEKKSLTGSWLHYFKFLCEEITPKCLLLASPEEFSKFQAYIFGLVDGYYKEKEKQ